MSNNQRKYIAISIKHTDKFPYVLWGYKRTADSEKRCFADYTTDPNKCELYSIEEFAEHYKSSPWYEEKVVTISELLLNFKKLKRKYDTVFIDKDEYFKFYGESK